MGDTEEDNVTPFPGPRLKQALRAYRQDFQGLTLRDLSPDGQISEVLIDDVRAMKHHILCLLAGVPDSDPRPMAYICRVGREHYPYWRYDARRDWVRCELCITVEGEQGGD